MPLHKQLPPLLPAQPPSPRPVPECDTPLSTMPARGTSTRRLNQQQQAEMQQQGAAKAARRKVAEQREAEQQQQAAKQQQQLQKSKEAQLKQQEEDMVAGAKKRLEFAEAREKAAQEWEAQQHARKASKHDARSAQCLLMHFASTVSCNNPLIE